MTDEQIKTLAFAHFDVDVDSRGREEFSCDDHGLIAFARRLLADHAEREAALRAEVERLKAAIDTQPSPPTREDMEWAGKVFLAEAEKENDALRAEVEALRNLLHRAGNALVCDGEVMSESDDEWTRSHACGRCDDYVDRGWPIRTEIRAALAAAKDAEAR